MSPIIFLITLAAMIILAATGWLVPVVLTMAITCPLLGVLLAAWDMGRTPTPHTHGPVIKALGQCPTCGKRFD